MDFTRDFMYRLEQIAFIAESAEYEYAMRESVLIETGLCNSENIISLQEGLIETVKNFFSKAPQLINDLYNKFEMYFGKKFEKDKEFINANIEIVKTKEIKEKTLQVYNYDLAKIKQKNDLRLNYESIKDDLDDILSIQKKLFPDFVTDTPEGFVDNVKKILRGNPEAEKPTIDGSKFNMDEALNFVLGYDKIKREISNDKKDIISTINVFKNLVNSKQSTVTNESYYSYLFNKAILLEEENTNAESKPEAPDTSSNNDNKPDSAQDKSVDKVMNSGSKSGSGNEFSTAFKRTKNGILVVSKFFSAKMTIVNECYNEYSSIIKNHINSYKSVNNPEDAPTPEQEQAVRKVLEKYIDTNGKFKQLDDEGKANLLNELKSAAKGKDAYVKQMFNNYINNSKS